MPQLALLLLVLAESSILGREQSAWLKDLDGSVPERRAAVFALGKLGLDAGPRVVPALTKALDDADPAVRAGAARGLSDLFRADRNLAATCWDATGPALMRRIDDRESRVRRAALVALGTCGPTAEPALAILRKAMGDPEAEVKQNAAWAIGSVGAIDAETLVDLCELLHDTDPMVRRDAIAALADLYRIEGNRPKMKDAGLALVRLIRQEITPEGKARDGVVLTLALSNLLAFGPIKIENLGPTLAPLLRGEDEELALLSAMTLASAGGTDATLGLSVLVRTLRTADPKSREMAAASLAQLGPLAEPAVKELAEAIRPDQAIKVRQNAAIALAQMKSKSRPAIPALIESIKRPANSEEETTLRRYAVEAVAQIGYPHNMEALPLMAELVAKEANWDIRIRAVWSFLGCEQLPADAAKALTQLIDEPLESDRSGATIEAARILARAQRDKAPPRAIEILDRALTSTMTKIFAGTGTRVNTGSEQNTGSTAAQDQTDPDARYMYAEALEYIGMAIKDSKFAEQVKKHLEDAVKEPGRPKLKENAERALKAIGF